MYWSIGEFDESSEKYKEALLIAQRLNLKDKEKECREALEIYRLYEEGKKFRNSGEYKESIESFQKAIELAREISSKEHEVNCLRQLGVAYWQMNNLKDFFYRNKEALNIAKYLNHRKEVGRCLNNIGLYYWKLNDYSKALIYFLEAVKIAEQEENKENEAVCLNNIGLIYQEMGSYEKSRGYLLKALSINNKLGFKFSISGNLNTLGETYRRMGIISGNEEDFNRALNYFYNCIKSTRKNKDRKTEIQALNNIGSVQTELKNYQDALQYFELCLRKAEENQDFEMIGMVLNNMGIVYYNQGNYEESTKCYLKAIELADKVKARHILWEAYFGLGQCHEKMNSYSQAIVFYKRAIDTIDDMRSQIFIDTYKAGFVRDKLNVYEILIDLLHRLNRNDSSRSYAKNIFNIVERAKARAFLECMAESWPHIKEGLSSEIVNRENEVSNRISVIMQELARPDLSKERREELLARLQQEEDEYMSLISKMRAEVPEVTNFLLLQPCQVEQVQEFLDEKTALIEYFLGENQSFMFFITRNRFDVYSLPPRKEIEKSLRAYLKILSDPPKRKFKGILASKRISRELFSPAGESISEPIKNLVIVPDGILYYLPFETLLDSQDLSSGDNYLVENYRISYAPSSSALLYLSENRVYDENSKGLLAFGNPSYTLKVSSKGKKPKTDVETLRELYLEQGFDFSPLPYSKREVLKIARYFPERKRDIFLEDEAREEAFKKASLEHYLIVHFACHGFLAEEFPFRSALVLSLDEDPQEDGFLQVREIYNLRLKADLIVLSACQTGKGKLEKSEGVLGLPRIFFYTGVKSVVSTLWKINDKSTAMFMNSFYYYLSQGNGKSQALRLAKLKMLNSKFSHPYYWAAFVLNGDYNSTLCFK